MLYSRLFNVDIYHFCVGSIAKILRHGKGLVLLLVNWYCNSLLYFKLIYTSTYYMMKYRSSKSSRPEVFCKKVVLRNFTEFTGKHPCQSLFI